MVPKYDAFGREIGEDTLGGLGSGATADPAPEDGSPAEPVAAEPEPTPASQPRAEHRSDTGPARRLLSGGRWLIVLVSVLVLFVVPVVAGVVALVNTVGDATEVVRGGIKEGLEARPVTPAKPTVAPKGIAGRSLVRKANFAAALRNLRSSELRLRSLRLAPERIDVQLLTRDGRLRSQQVQPGRAIRQFGPDSGPGFDQSNTIPFALLKAGAPQRLARSGAAKLGVPVSTLQYLVPTLFSGKITWAAYFKRGRYVLGDASGRYQRSYP